jgi:hypothetical protein
MARFWSRKPTEQLHGAPTTQYRRDARAFTRRSRVELNEGLLVPSTGSTRGTSRESAFASAARAGVQRGVPDNFPFDASSIVSSRLHAAAVWTPAAAPKTALCMAVVKSPAA